MVSSLELEMKLGTEKKIQRNREIEGDKEMNESFSER